MTQQERINALESPLTKVCSGYQIPAENIMKHEDRFRITFPHRITEVELDARNPVRTANTVSARYDGLCEQLKTFARENNLVFIASAGPTKPAIILADREAYEAEQSKNQKSEQPRTFLELIKKYNIPLNAERKLFNGIPNLGRLLMILHKNVMFPGKDETARSQMTRREIARDALEQVADVTYNEDAEEGSKRQFTPKYNLIIPNPIKLDLSYLLNRKNYDLNFFFN